MISIKRIFVLFAATGASFALIAATAASTLSLPTHEQFVAFVHTKASQTVVCQALIQESDKLTSPPYVAAPGQNPFLRLTPSLADWISEVGTGIECLSLLQREEASDTAQSVPRKWAMEACDALKTDYQFVDQRCARFSPSPSP